jgi:hypothetical protein
MRFVGLSERGTNVWGLLSGEPTGIISTDRQAPRFVPREARGSRPRRRISADLVNGVRKPLLPIRVQNHVNENLPILKLSPWGRLEPRFLADDLWQALYYQLGLLISRGILLRCGRCAQCGRLAVDERQSSGPLERRFCREPNRICKDSFHNQRKSRQSKTDSQRTWRAAERARKQRLATRQMQENERTKGPRLLRGFLKEAQKKNPSALRLVKAVGSASKTRNGWKLVDKWIAANQAGCPDEKIWNSIEEPVRALLLARLRET